MTAVPVEWQFSNRIRIGEKKLVSDSDQQLLYECGQERVALRVLVGDTFSNAESLILSGARYWSSDDAHAAGRLWRQYVSMALVIGRFGADFDPVPRTSRCDDDRPVDDAAPGLVVSPIKNFDFRSEGTLSLTVARPMSQFVDVDLPRVRAAKPSGLTDRNDLELAFRMYHLSLMSDDIDVQYILLVTVIEALIPDAKPFKDDPDVIMAIDELITFAKDLQRFPSAIKDKLIGVLNYAKEESILSMGAKLSQRVAARTYNGLAPDEYFRRAYRRRSSLVHGGLSKKTGAPIDRQDLFADAEMLRRFVEDLLALEIGHREANGGESTID